MSRVDTGEVENISARGENWVDFTHKSVTWL